MSVPQRLGNREKGTGKYLSRRRMQHPNILPGHNVDQFTSFNMPNLDKIRLKGEYVRIGQGKGIRIPFPANLPVGTGTPTIPIHEEGEIAVVQEEFPIQSLNVDRAYVFSSRHKVERRIGLVEKGLGFRCFETDYFESSRAADA